MEECYATIAQPCEKYRKDNRNTPTYQGRKLRAGCTGIIRLSSLNLFNTLHFRNIKVNQIHYMRKLKNAPCGAGRPVPWIQLKGYWLQQAGFAINTPVKVRVIDGCLVLTTTDEPAGS
jgi:hypothetical protein